MTKAEVVIALGSNLGNRSGYLTHALTKMKDLGMKVLVLDAGVREIAFLGVIQNQNNFLNSAVLAITNDPPFTLLKKMKEVESELGRDLFNGVQGGPRNIDLDLICYGETTQNSPELTLPHPRWKERDFVKIPLRDLALGYSSDLTDSTQKVTGFLNQVPEVPLGINQDLETISQVFPLPSGAIERFGDATWMMSVMNITPDSFADTQRHLSHQGILNKESILEYMKKSVENGVRILDVGGQSTRPGSTLLTADEELVRIQSVIKLLMERLGPKRPLISIDTFHSSVARSSVQEGVDIVNDISGGTMDPLMLQTVAELKVPFILQHIRGTPQTMLKKENITYSTDPVKDIGQELQKQAEAAMEAGIPGWSIILDPGVGFSKTKETSFQLVKELSRLKGEVLKGTCAKMPLLVGLSRKRFIESLIGERIPAARDVASGALMMDCIRNGVDILRTHNPKFTKDIINVADALYRDKHTA